MTITPKPLYTGGQLGNTAGVLYTCPSNTRAVVTTATFTNTDTVNQTLTLYIVRSGASPSAANTLINAQPIAPPPAPAYIATEIQGYNLTAGDSIRALASTAAKITCAGINGFELA